MFDNFVKTKISDVIGGCGDFYYHPSFNWVAFRALDQAVYILNIETDQLVQVGTMAGNPTFMFGYTPTFGSDGNLYIAPVRTNIFYRINFGTQSLDTLGVHGSVGVANSYHCVAYGDAIYYVPHDFSQMCKYDISSETFIPEWSDPLTNYGNASALVGSEIYMAPGGSTSVFRKINLDTGAISSLSGSGWNSTWYAMIHALGPDQCLYASVHGTWDSTNDRLVKVDTVSDSWSFIGPHLGSGIQYGIGSMHTVGGKIFIVPRGIPSRGLMEFDPYAETITNVFSTPQAMQSYNGGQLDRSGSSIIADLKNPESKVAIFDLSDPGNVQEYVQDFGFGSSWCIFGGDISSGRIFASNTDTDEIYSIADAKVVISGISPENVYNGGNISISGTGFLGDCVVEVCDQSDYALANRYSLNVLSVNLNHITATMENGGGWYGDAWVFVTNTLGERNAIGFLVTILEPDMIVIGGDRIGYGHLPFGRHPFGGISSPIEPRFLGSNPADDSVGVSTIFVIAKTSIYCFSSRIQSIRVEIKEGESEFTDAYNNGSFVYPYDAPDSYVDFHQADPQMTTIKIEKRFPWDENIEVMIRVTATDQFGNEATEELPITW